MLGLGAGFTGLGFLLLALEFTLGGKPRILGVTLCLGLGFSPLALYASDLGSGGAGGFFLATLCGGFGVGAGLRGDGLFVLALPAGFGFGAQAGEFGGFGFAAFGIGQHSDKPLHRLGLGRLGALGEFLPNGRLGLAYGDQKLDGLNRPRRSCRLIGS